jgi:uncharacterized membrane protein
VSPSTLTTSAKAVNATGQIVGASQFSTRLDSSLSGNGQVGEERAVIWKDDALTPTDLNALIPRDSGWMLETATAINDAGQIVGYGTYQGESKKIFLLTPL